MEWANRANDVRTSFGQVGPILVTKCGPARPVLVDLIWSGRTSFCIQNWSGGTNFARTNFSVTVQKVAIYSIRHGISTSFWYKQNEKQIPSKEPRLIHSISWIVQSREHLIVRRRNEHSNDPRNKSFWVNFMTRQRIMCIQECKFITSNHKPETLVLHV